MTAEIFILIKIFKLIPGNLIYVCWISQSLIRAVGTLVWMEVDALLPPMANPTSVPVPPATRELVVKSVRKFHRFTAFFRDVHYNNMLYTVKYINILFQKMKTSVWVAPARMGEFVWTNRTASGASVLWELAGSTSRDHFVKPKHQNVSQPHKIKQIYCERHSHLHVKLVDAHLKACYQCVGAQYIFIKSMTQITPWIHTWFSREDGKREDSICAICVWVII